MATVSTSVEAGQGDAAVTLVDPRAPRFGQSITALGLALGIVLGIPAFVYAITAILLAAVLSGWRYDLYGIVWRNAIQPRIGKPDEPEPAAPHRFAKLLGATGTTIASALVLAGFPLAGYAIAAAVAAAAGLAAATGICLGCHMYRQVSFFRRIDVV